MVKVDFLFFVVSNEQKTKKILKFKPYKMSKAYDEPIMHL